ncbi:MAG TPA: hypothetical protein DD381_01195 [Lentisphaeria bacterium]|nr:MAG: hypothetical protein A2X47_13465 [Lentisphaerae bacterium GWF2_38_69]HBM14959.1 hypothetical protein [Lentisphaeria bacterium]
MILKEIDVAIIGAGAAGLACAIKLHDSGIQNIVIFERNPFLGGILRQCIHLGFGLTYFNEELTGPQYADKLVKNIKDRNIGCRLNSMVLDISEDKILTVSSPQDGIMKYKTRTIVFAVGCRERTRDNIEVPGTRPMGVFTAGQAQTLINLHGLKIGQKVVIQGSGDIGLIMARRLKIEGYDVIAVLETLPYLSGLIRNKVQCLDHFGIPLMLSSRIKKICGRKRVSGVYVETENQEQYYDCDTVLFSVGLIPELELARNLGLNIQDNSNIAVNSAFEGTKDGIFFCGNCLHINDLADNASLEGEKAASFVAEYLRHPEVFREGLTNKLPYCECQKYSQYNNDFFYQLKDGESLVCIICPKSCILSKGSNPCQRGKDYLSSITSEGFSQRLTTTVLNSQEEYIPIVTKESVSIESFPEKVKELKIKMS